MSGVEIMAIAGLAMAAAGTALSAKQASDTGKYNAAVAEQEGEAAQQQAQFETDRLKERTQRLLSEQRAAIGGSGLELEGSPLLVMEETAANAAFDALVIKHAGSAAEARARSQAALDRMGARSAQTSGFMGAGSTILTGATELGYIYGKSKPKPTQTQVSGDPYGSER